jgi:hypothetical protein
MVELLSEVARMLFGAVPRQSLRATILSDHIGPCALGKLFTITLPKILEFLEGRLLLFLESFMV